LRSDNNIYVFQHFVRIKTIRNKCIEIEKLKLTAELKLNEEISRERKKHHNASEFRAKQADRMNILRED
jgi:hypothetical protein